MTRSSRISTAVLVLSLAVLLLTPASAPAATSKVTQEDCDAGRVKDRHGNTISGERCERLIGRNVRLAETGFEAWWFAAGGAACLGAALALRLRPRRRIA